MHVGEPRLNTASPLLGMATLPLRTPTSINFRTLPPVSCVGGYYQHQHSALVASPWPHRIVVAIQSLQDGLELVVGMEDTSHSSIMGKPELLTKFRCPIPLTKTLDALQGTMRRGQPRLRSWCITALLQGNDICLLSSDTP